MTDNKRVEIKPAKGRPMLSWVGKKPLRDVIAYPAQLIETFAPEHALKSDNNLWKDWPEKSPKEDCSFMVITRMCWRICLLTAFAAR